MSRRYIYDPIRDRATLEEGMVAVANLLMIPVTIASAGWALWCLWGWFLLPLGLPPLSYANSAGLVVFGAFLRYGGGAGDPTERLAVLMAASFVAFPLIVLSGLIIATLGGLR